MPKGLQGFQKGNKLGIGNKYALGMPPNKTSFKKGDNIGSNHPKWVGGRVKHDKYIMVYTPNHPYCTKRKYVFEHRLVVEKQIGRYLTPKEMVHHIGEKDDNRPKKLMAFTCRKFHIQFEVGKHIDPQYIIFDGRKLKARH